MRNGAVAVALVLCTGIDPVLMETRRLILERAGHRVIFATSEKELQKACTEQGCDVAVIGQTLSANIKLRILRLLRQHCPSAAVLELHPQYADRALNDADGWLAMPTDHPRELADAVDSLVRKPSSDITST
jgi:CheY-like chemotaxis protein